MPEDRRTEGDPMETRLKRLVQQWSQGRVSLKQMMGLSDVELHAIASQGYNLFLQGKTDAARVVFEGLLAIDPRNAYYYRALGAIYWRLKEAEKALRQFSYAIRVAPRDISSFVNRAEIYVSTRRFDLARKDLYHAIDHGGPQDRALVRKARAMLRMI